MSNNCSKSGKKSRAYSKFKIRLYRHQSYANSKRSFLYIEERYWQNYSRTGTYTFSCEVCNKLFKMKNFNIIFIVCSVCEKFIPII